MTENRSSIHSRDQEQFAGTTSARYGISTTTRYGESSNYHGVCLYSKGATKPKTTRTPSRESNTTYNSTTRPPAKRHSQGQLQMGNSKRGNRKRGNRRRGNPKKEPQPMKIFDQPLGHPSRENIHRLGAQYSLISAGTCTS